MNSPNRSHILRVEKDRNYKTINLQAVSGGTESDGSDRWSRDLSWKAVGLHTYLVTRPDGWSFNRSDLINRHSDGRHAVKSGLQELEDAGLLFRQREHDEEGRFGWTWYVSECPLDESEWESLIKESAAPEPEKSAPRQDFRPRITHGGKSTPSNEEEVVREDGSSSVSSSLRSSDTGPGARKDGTSEGGAGPTGGGERLTSGPASPNGSEPTDSDTSGGGDLPPTGRMHEIYLEELGGEPPHPSLTDKRRGKYERLWEEHLAGRDEGWEEWWRALLGALQDSDHHMSERSYQMPESFLRNPERRDRWMQEAASGRSSREKVHPSNRHAYLK